jgi:teichuronic acid exporter
MNSLKSKAINGVLWSIIENFINKGLLFVVGVILARLLSPTDFGLIGMITIIIAVSQSLVDAGFSQALIRNDKATTKDYSTVFIFNFLFSILIYLILFFSSTKISEFFNQPKLVLLIKVLAINIIINSFGLVQRTKLIKRLDFKTQAKISIVAGLMSGAIGILLAYSDFGVWSLVAKTTAFSLITVILLYIYTGWSHQLYFDAKSFKEMFAFGFKITIAGLIDSVFNNIYYIIIGKYFSAAQLGFYTRAEQFNNLPSSNLTTVVQRVSYPVLSQLQNQPTSLKHGYKKVITSTMIVSFVLMIGMAAIAEPLVITLIGEKWRTSVGYLQLLCFVGMLYPLHGINLNMLKVKGRTDLLLKLEVIKKLLSIPVIIVGVVYGIKWMLVGLILNSLIAYFLNSNWSGKLINYSSFEQLRDILPSFYVAITAAVIVLITGRLLLQYDHVIQLFVQIALGAIIVFALCELFKINSYLNLKEIVRDKFGRK